MGKNYYLRWTALFVLLISVFASCEKEFDKYYELPGWMKGNAWEVLEQDGNYTMFLSAIDKGGYKEVVAGKGIITVMAPNNTAFGEFLAANGYSSVEDMAENDLELLQKTVNFHLLYYSFNKTQMANYQPYGPEYDILFGLNEIAAGIFYKFRTRSQDPMDIVTLTTPSTGYTRDCKVYHRDRFVPIFSSYLFQTNANIDAKANYEYFYPNSTWTGDGGGFNVSNASVTEYAVPTDNGYIYRISQVLEPLETIENYMTKLADEEGDNTYIYFRDLYDKFAGYAYDADLTASYGATAVDSIFVKESTGLPSISSEWSNSHYLNMDILAAVAQTAFVPQNQVLTAFENDYFSEFSNGLRSLPRITLRYLLGSHVTNGYFNIEIVGVAGGATIPRYSGVVFPENINNTGTVTDYWGNPVMFNTVSDVVKSKMCINGAFYGLNKVLVPTLFESVAKPMFQDPDYNAALHMANNAVIGSDNITGMPISVLTLLGQPNTSGTNVNYTVFLSDNQRVENSTYNGYPIRLYSVGNTDWAFGTEEMQLLGDEDWGTMSGASATSIMYSHIITKEMTPNTDANYPGRVYKALGEYNYLLIRGDTVISPFFYNAGSVEGSPLYDKNAPLYDNGGNKAYALTGGVNEMLRFDLQNIAPLFSSTAVPAHMRQFATLLVSSGTVGVANSAFDYTLGERFIMFVPSNEAILAGIDDGTISPPLEDDDDDVRVEKAAALKQYLKRYLVSVPSSFPVDYPFPGSLATGNVTIRTYAQRNEGALIPDYHTFTMRDNSTSLSLFDGMNNEVNVTSLYPYIYYYGAVYTIDGLLKLDTDN